MLHYFRGFKKPLTLPFSVISVAKPFAVIQFTRVHPWQKKPLPPHQKLKPRDS
jgi:hypothetical protein